MEEPIDEDLVLGIGEEVEEQRESEQQKEVTLSGLVQSLELPMPALQIGESSQSNISAVEAMEVRENTLVVPSELADDAMANFQLINQMERAASSRNKDLLIDEEEQEMSDNEDEEMPVIEPEEVQEVEEVEDRDSPDCKIASSSDSESLMSKKSTIDGSRKARKQRWSAASQTTVNAPGLSLSIVIDEKE